MEKNLRLNEDKCVVITIGTKKQREETNIQLKTNPTMCGKFEMKQAEKEKWLGQQISAGGLAESVAETVAAKEGKIKAACIEVANIVNDWRTEIVGGLETAMISWEAWEATPAHTWETGLIHMRLRIWKEKLILILHIRRLEGTALANKIYNESTKKRRMAWLGKRNKRNLRRIEYYGCKYNLPHKE